MVTFNLHEQQTDGEHRFSVYDCVGDAAGALSDQLATRVRNLYVDPEELKEVLLRAATGLDDVADPALLDALVQQVTKAVVPEPGVVAQGQPPHLDLARNEVAEVIAYEAVESIHGAVIPAQRIREKEVPGLPTRGLDLLALILLPTLKLLVAEVKASSAAESPPAVVSSGVASLHAQTKALVADTERLIRELNWSLKHCPDEELKTQVAAALLRLAMNDLPIVAVPVLVRPLHLHGADDFGCFRTSPDQYPPATVHFCLARIEGTLEALAQDVYTKARATP